VTPGAFTIYRTPGVTVLGWWLVALQDKSGQVVNLLHEDRKGKGALLQTRVCGYEVLRGKRWRESLLQRFSSLPPAWFYLYFLINILTAQNQPDHGQKLPFLVWFNYAAIGAKFHNALDHTAVSLAAQQNELALAAGCFELRYDRYAVCEHTLAVDQDYSVCLSFRGIYKLVEGYNSDAKMFVLPQQVQNVAANFVVENQNGKSNILSYHYMRVSE